MKSAGNQDACGNRRKNPDRAMTTVEAMPTNTPPTTTNSRSFQEESRTQWVGADSILFATAHRPWPTPMTPWIMTQRWNDLLFLHYPVEPEALRLLVPEVLTLDTYKQRAWGISISSILPRIRSRKSMASSSGSPWCLRFVLSAAFRKY